VAEFVADPTHQEFPSSTVNFTNMTNNGNWTYVWDFGDGSTSSQHTPQEHIYDTWGDYEIWLHTSTPHCRDSISHRIRIFAAAPRAEYDTVYPGCEPLTVEFNNTSLYGKDFLWEFDDGVTSEDPSPTHTFDKAGVYNVKLTVSGEGGIDYAYRQVEVYHRPVVDFRVEPKLVMLPDQQIQVFNLTEYGDFYLWDFGDGNTSSDENPNYQYSEIGVYDITLDAWTIHNCAASMTLPEAVRVEAEGTIIFPNAFKPDLDGPNGGYYDINAFPKNNIFRPHWEGVSENGYELLVYSRWGELLFTSYDVNIGWDGYVNGTLASQGVYIWKCIGTFINGTNFNLAGDVTLLYHKKD
jgi:PKD repeat protein